MSHSEISERTAIGGDADRESGWYIAIDDDQLGPLAAAEAWALLIERRASTSIYVWHPSLREWTQLPLAVPAATSPPLPVGPNIDFGTVELSNSTYIAWLACVISPVFVLGAALARDSQDLIVAGTTVAVVALLGWWLYLEKSGIRLHQGELRFPARLGVWPYPPFGMRRLRLSDVTSFECWSHGSARHWFQIHGATRSSRLLLDKAFDRQILASALERNLPHIGATMP